MKLSRGALALIIIAVIIVVDQVVKIYVKTHFYLGEDVEVLPFFYLRFVENPGMAFGMQLGSKLFLTVFRIIAVIALVWYLVKLRNSAKVPLGYIVCIALITAGAAGNIFDCVFYGEIFNDPGYGKVAEFVPWGHGYGSLLHGKVVDMLYFPLFSFTWPEWMPWLGGKVFSFFDPVFNVADAAISVGIIALLLFYRKYVLVMSDQDVEQIDNKTDNESTKE